MKKLLFLFAVATLGLTACKKDHTCTCTYDYGTGTDVVVASTVNSKKAVALALCEDEGYEVISVTVDGTAVDLTDDDSDPNTCTLD